MKKQQCIKINWRKLTPWLKAQPKNTTFDYSDPNGCLLCAFLKDTHGYKNPSVSPDDVDEVEHGNFVPEMHAFIPNRIANVMLNCANRSENNLVSVREVLKELNR